MAWLAIDKNGDEGVYQEHPRLNSLGEWCETYEMLPPLQFVMLPEGTIEKILGYKLTFETSPVEI